MSLSDAFVRIMCDFCDEEEEAELPFVYSGIMHTFGYYDHKKPRLPNGWAKTDDDQHKCPNCVEDGASK